MHRPKSNTRHRRPNESWDHVSDWYDSLVGAKGQYFHQRVIFPKLLPLLELKPGQEALDLACGQGAFSRELASRGAHVVGIDASSALIEKARNYSASAIPGWAQHRPRKDQDKRGIAGSKGHSFEKNEQFPIEYLVDDARTLEKVTGKQFDRIVSILALQNIDPLDGLFAQVSSLLAPSGTFTAVILHPAFRSPRITGWGEDERRDLQYRRVDRYLSPMKIPIDMHPGREKRSLTWTYHRPLSYYVSQGTKVGFAIDAIEEWTSDKESVGRHAKKENLAREEIPMFAAIRYRKI